MESNEIHNRMESNEVRTILRTPKKSIESYGILWNQWNRLNQMKWPGHYSCRTKYILNLEVSCKTNLTAKSRALPDSHHHG